MPTREEMVDRLKRIYLDHNGLKENRDADNQTLVDAIAELQKRCGNCRHFRDPNDAVRVVIAPHPFCSLNGGLSPIPRDGSGFCHRWEVIAPPVNTEGR